MPPRLRRPLPARRSPSSSRRSERAPRHRRRLVDGVADVVDRRGDDGVWITAVGREQLRARAAELEADPGLRELPLFGIPFAVKDNIDVAGLPTTCGCPEYAYVTRHDRPGGVAAARGRRGAGREDQPRPVRHGSERHPLALHDPRNVHGGELIAGGSSSGSALAVATGQVPFAVATDTAGSGRVPAALNAHPRLQALPGLLSTAGLGARLPVAGLHEPDGEDGRGPPPRVRRGGRTRRRRPVVPAARTPFGGAAEDRPAAGGRPAVPRRRPMRRAHTAGSRRGVAGRPGRRGAAGPVPAVPAICCTRAPGWPSGLPNSATSWPRHPDAVHPVVAEILEGGRQYTAVDAFRAQYRLQELRAEVAGLWADVDVVVLPTVATTFTVAEVLENPIATNTALGLYTHCGNLLDLCAVVVPAGNTDDGRPCSLDGARARARRRRGARRGRPVDRRARLQPLADIGGDRAHNRTGRGRHAPVRAAPQSPS